MTDNVSEYKSTNPIIQKYLDMLDCGKLDIEEISPCVFNVRSAGELIFSVSFGFLVIADKVFDIDQIYDGKSFKDIDKLARKCQSMVQNSNHRTIIKKPYQESKYDKVVQKIHQICSPGHHGVKNVTLEEFNDKDFQKWWAHHPWRMIRVDEGHVVMHNNMLIVYAVMLTFIGLGLTAGFIDGVKWYQYKQEKSQLTEKQIQDKYSDFQILFPLILLRFKGIEYVIVIW